MIGAAPTRPSAEDKDGDVTSVRAVRGRLHELGRGVGRGMVERVLASGDALRARRNGNGSEEGGLGRGAVLVGTVWPGGIV